MREVEGDLWNTPADAHCVTTNSVLNNRGELVMGAGVAKAAMLRYPELPRILGLHVKQHGNTPLYVAQYRVISFPTKHDWRAPSDLRLIEESAQRIASGVGRMSLGSVALTRPGCGLGRLPWGAVKMILLKYFDDRFVVVNPVCD